MLLIFILIIILIIIGILLIKQGIEDEIFSKQLIGFILTTINIILLIIVCYYNYTNSEITPQAIDVYRGMTTLQITYQDSVPIDTIVVFK